MRDDSTSILSTTTWLSRSDIRWRIVAKLLPWRNVSPSTSPKTGRIAWARAIRSRSSTMQESKSTGKALTARKRAADERAAIGFGCNLRSARAAGRRYGKTLRTIIDPKANRTTSMSSIAKDQHRVLETSVRCQGEGTGSAPDGRATRCHESAAAQGGVTASACWQGCGAYLKEGHLRCELAS
jgi:hypothetical protein